MDRSKYTEQFLKQISNHLSSRRRYNSIEYIVEISDKTISWYPPAQVYPSIHERQLSDKNSIVYHILKYHMQDALSDETLDSANSCVIEPGYLLSGTYQFNFNYNSFGKHTRRRWIRVK